MRMAGIKRPIFLALIVMFTVSPTNPALTEEKPEDKKYAINMLWEKAGASRKVLAVFDGKAIVLCEDANRKMSVELLSTETGEDLWINQENDLKNDIAQSDKHYYSSDVKYFESQKLLFIKFDFRNTDLACYKVDSGELLWKWNNDKVLQVPGVIDGNIAYTLRFIFEGYSCSGYLITLDISTGEVAQISSQIEHMNGIAKIFGKFKDKIFIQQEGFIYVYNLETQKFYTLMENDEIYFQASDFVLYKDKIIAHQYFYEDEKCTNSKILAIDINTENVVWNYKGFNVFTISGDVLVFRSYTGCRDDIKKSITFVNLDSGKLIKVFSDYDMDGPSIISNDKYVAIYYSINKKIRIQIFDHEARLLLTTDLMSMQVSMFGIEEFVSSSSKGNLLIIPAKMYVNGKYENNMFCFEIVENPTSIVMKPSLTLDGYSCVYSDWRFQMCAKFDDDGKISDLSMIDASSNADLWMDGSSDLKKQLLGAPKSSLQISIFNNMVYSHVYADGKRASMACHDFVTGKLKWKSALLKDLRLPAATFGGDIFLTSFDENELRLFRIEGNTGKILNKYKLTGQKMPFTVYALTDQRAIIFDGAFAMYHYKTGYNAWRDKTSYSKEMDLRDSFLGEQVFVTVADANDKDCQTMIVGKNLYSGKQIWTVKSDPVMTVWQKQFYSIAGFSCKASPEIRLINSIDGTIAKFGKINPESIKGFSFAKLVPVDSRLALFLQNGENTRLLFFDELLAQIGMWDFVGKRFEDCNSRLGTLFLTFKDAKTNTPEFRSIKIHYSN